MGQWAEIALNRFLSTANETRKSEELELVRHNRLQAQVERTWAALGKFVLNETKDFNKRLGREFFTNVTSSDVEISVEAPRG